MLVRILSMTFDSSIGGFNDSEVREFLKDKEVISIQEHFFMKNEVPYLTMVIKYFPFRQEVDAVMAPQGKRDEAWRESLSEGDMGKFNLLREWRSKRSREEGVPPYILFTNKQLAQVIKENPPSLAQLERIEGVGKSRVEKYGKDVLEILCSQLQKPVQNSLGQEEIPNAVHGGPARPPGPGFGIDWAGMGGDCSQSSYKLCSVFRGADPNTPLITPNLLRNESFSAIPGTS